MEAKELFVADGKSAGVWYCSKCKIVKKTEAEAEGCCKPRLCRDCGCELPSDRWTVNCSKCSDAWYAKQRQDRLEKAELVDAGDQIMFMVEELCGHDDGWFRDIDEIIDYCFDEEPGCYPEFAFCSKPEQRQIDISDVLERICEDGYEDMGDNLSGVRELEAAIHTFNVLNEDRLKVYNVDYSRKVRIPWPAQNS